MQKNDFLVVEITSLTGGGDGIAHAPDGRVVFVPNTAVGDIAEVIIIKVKKTYALGKLKSIVKPAIARITSNCDISSKCGGCVFRHIDYLKECEIKSNQVLNSFNRIAKIDVSLNKIVGAENTDYYRNKAQIPVGLDKCGNIICGYYAKSSHRIIPCSTCLLHPQIFNDIIKTFCLWANKYKFSVYNESTKTGLLRHIYIRQASVTKQIMVAIVINGTNIKFADNLIEDLLKICQNNLKSVIININTDNTNVILGEKSSVLYGTDYIEDEICGVKLRISLPSFYQVNHDMAEKLYNKAIEYADCKNKTVLDLYCGTGSIGLIASKTAKYVYGAEIVPYAIENANINKTLNKADNIEFLCADAAQAAQKFKSRNIKPDVVIIDPPRKGCEKKLIDIICYDFCPDRVVYVSCNDATLARDCAEFENFGYIVTEATPFDLFPRTGHVEMVVLMSRA